MTLPRTSYKTVPVEGLNIFYREAGSLEAPTLLLLHGFPSSSFMFRDLITELGNDYHLIAPDYPGFGNSDSPDVASFDYTFDHLADVMEKFTDAGAEFDSMTRLDQWKTTLLLRAKKRIEGSPAAFGTDEPDLT